MTIPKLLLTGLLTGLWGLLAGPAHGQAGYSTWPLSPTDSAVVISGRATWPAGATTEAQRQAYVRQWYVRHLINISEKRMQSDVTEAKATGHKGEVIYADLYRRAGLSDIDSTATALLYSVDVVADAAGFTYRLYDFDLQDFRDPKPGLQHYSLAQALRQPRFRRALVRYRQRLGTAQAALQ